MPSPQQAAIAAEEHLPARLWRASWQKESRTPKTHRLPYGGAATVNLRNQRRENINSKSRKDGASSCRASPI